MTRHHLRSSTRKPTGTGVERLAAEKIEPTCESADALASAPLATKAGSAASLKPARIRGTPSTQVTKTAKVKTEPSTLDWPKGNARSGETTFKGRRKRSDTPVDYSLKQADSVGRARCHSALASRAGNPFLGMERNNLS